MDNDTQIRELFIDELVEVTGGAGAGGPVEELIRKIKDGQHSTMACCEEGDCCNEPW